MTTWVLSQQHEDGLIFEHQLATVSHYSEQFVNRKEKDATQSTAKADTTFKPSTLFKTWSKEHMEKYILYNVPLKPQ